VAVLVSGTGSILDAMLADEVPVALVLADRACRALEIAAAAGVDTELVDRQDFGGYGKAFDRWGFTRAVATVLGAHDIDAGRHALSVQESAQRPHRVDV